MEIIGVIDEKMLFRKKNDQFNDVFPLYFDGKVFRKLVVCAVSYVFRSMTSHTFTLLLAL